MITRLYSFVFAMLLMVVPGELRSESFTEISGEMATVINGEVSTLRTHTPTVKSKVTYWVPVEPAVDCIEYFGDVSKVSLHIRHRQLLI